MSQTAQQWLPVGISILVIIAIALIQAHSKTLGVIATLIFAVALWLASRAGMGLVAMLATAYLAWAAAVGLYLAISR